MQLDLTDEETLALLNPLTDRIERDRYPLSPRIRALRGILAKFGPMAPPPPARPPTPPGATTVRRPAAKANLTAAATPITYYPSQNARMASCSAPTLVNPRSAAAALRPPNCRASAETLLP
jgi:hypothetical protein